MLLGVLQNCVYLLKGGSGQTKMSPENVSQEPADSLSVAGKVWGASPVQTPAAPSSEPLLEPSAMAPLG